MTRRKAGASLEERVTSAGSSHFSVGVAGDDAGRRHARHDCIGLDRSIGNGL
jgi:hypothetical protein